MSFKFWPKEPLKNHTISCFVLCPASFFSSFKFLLHNGCRSTSWFIWFSVAQKSSSIAYQISQSYKYYKLPVGPCFSIPSLPNISVYTSIILFYVLEFTIYQQTAELDTLLSTINFRNIFDLVESVKIIHSYVCRPKLLKLLT